METVKVRLVITRDSKLGGSIEKIKEVEPESTPTKTKSKAQLLFLNEYISRDFGASNYDNLKAAKNVAKLKIKATIIK